LKAKKKNSTKLLISFRNIKEISDQKFKYFDICDLKDPSKGSIGAWGEKNIIEVVKRCNNKVKVSATIGDIFSVERILKKLKQFDSFGLDYIKFGINTKNVLELKDLICTIGKLKCKTKLVLVIFVDKNSIFETVEENLGIFYRNNVRFLILDTYEKGDENLISYCRPSKIKDFIKKCSIKRINVGLAGRLQTNHITKLKLLNPYVIGFRSAICSDLNRQYISEEKLTFLSNQFFLK
jgi:uncharacterized protein (UPF0264 family)